MEASPVQAYNYPRIGQALVRKLELLHILELRLRHFVYFKGKLVEPAVVTSRLESFAMGLSLLIKMALTNRVALVTGTAP